MEGSEPQEAGEFLAGVARRDITPANGGTFFGYARPDKIADGVASRLYAHVLVLDDGARKVALVAADLGAPMVYETVLDHVEPLGYDRDTFLFACTHTHAGPNDVGDWIAAQIGDAVAAADRTRGPAIAGWGTADVPDANRSRSVEAHLANHGQDHQPGTGHAGLDPDGPDHPRDTTVRVLRVDDAGGGHIAAWAQFPVHPTAYIPANTKFSADLAGVATRAFEAGFGTDDGPLAMYTSGALGDLIPVYDDYNMHAVADCVGRRLARGMQTAWEDAGGRLSPDPVVDGRATTVSYEGQEIEPEKRVASEGTFGLPFFGGGQNGPSLFYDAGLEGLRRPAADADPVQGRKIVVDRAPWASEVVAQSVRVGDRLLVAFAGEPTTETGRRVRSAVATAGPDSVTDVVVIGLANGYHGYFTTPEEYDQQHYEGGHTVFGKYTSLLMEQAHVDLASDLAEGPSTAREPSGSRPEPPEPPVGRGSAEARVTAEPREIVERMEVVELGWDGGEAGRDRPVEEPFLELQRANDGDAGWATVATDLDVGFVWEETDGAYTARYDVPPGLSTGTYRLRVQGSRYELESREFEIRPSTRLRVLGVTASQKTQATSVTIYAQNPPPNPDRNLRSRSVWPAGETVTFSIAGARQTADWDEATGGFTATVGDSIDDPVVVPDSGLLDRYGNRSGDAVEVTVGEVEDVDWPPHIGSGGTRPPAPDDVVELLEAVQDLVRDGLDGNAGL